MQMTQMTGATNWEKSKEYWRNTPFVYDCLQFSRVYRCNRYIISIELGEVRQVHGKSQMFPGVPSFGSLGSAQQGSELNMTQAIHYCLRALPAMVEWWNSQGPPG